MVKLFKIIEKIVWVIAALAIVLVVIMMVYGIITNTQQGWQEVIPYLYLAAFLFTVYKAVVIFFTSFSSRLLQRSLPISVIRIIPNSKEPAFLLFSITFRPSRNVSKSRICENRPSISFPKNDKFHSGKLPSETCSFASLTE